ncbi:uncharacterized protein N7477_010089 [Penicillium maclennaniae]|uniref:uncharacterized protein n=1 Tax=Penicillium maclennaniae TaxID=1343394 RepID=UPI002541B1F0|nr:uncharacterized protein N7477_010089 [Penicillium maclennaniae]KAJ5662473.1 hypothetical protein N7477_010089 [Penicillium maclennaniae]
MPPPILLLKTRSSPNDGYEEFFTANNYTPTFVPVLEHRFNDKNLAHVRSLFITGAFNASDNGNSKTSSPKYGGMIFTSQRAVEGFANMISQHGLSPPSQDIPLYTVGPATARTLTTLRNAHLPSSTIHGADTGTGEKLAHLMLQHYNTLHDTEENPKLLFLVGEQRRDIIPKTLMDPNIPQNKQIPVEEVVVYETGEMESFEGDFRKVMELAERESERVVWVVVFSPSGCEAMLRVLELGPYAKDDGGRGNVFVATIGPTTRDHLRGLGFEPHVCAEKPSPEGVGEGIRRFMEERGLGNSS